MLENKYVYYRDSNLSFKTICNVQSLNCVDKPLASTPNSVLCLCDALAGSETEEATILTLKFPSL